MGPRDLQQKALRSKGVVSYVYTPEQVPNGVGFFKGSSYEQAWNFLSGRIGRNGKQIPRAQMKLKFADLQTPEWVVLQTRDELKNEVANVLKFVYGRWKTALGMPENVAELADQEAHAMFEGLKNDPKLPNITQFPSHLKNKHYRRSVE